MSYSTQILCQEHFYSERAVGGARKILAEFPTDDPLPRHQI